MDLDELKKRKEELLLTREIERLERDSKRRANAERWSWWWVVPLAFAGACCLLVVAAAAKERDGFGLAVLAGLAAALAFAPLVWKLLARR